MLGPLAANVRLRTGGRAGRAAAGFLAGLVCYALLFAVDFSVSNGMGAGS